MLTFLFCRFSDLQRMRRCTRKHAGKFDSIVVANRRIAATVGRFFAGPIGRVGATEWRVCTLGVYARAKLAVIISSRSNSNAMSWLFRTHCNISSIVWVRLILQPFRYLNSIANSKQICERLFDVIFSSSDKMVRWFEMTSPPVGFVTISHSSDVIVVFFFQ